ncbi:hypothetical protein BDA99DRAFT_512829 [Phascolomyces articulosus]|uniref:F-box domain-containing protein n=1 Tax=Phascolomyces articulosus TaxID=60185 RepID=A0AAD5PD18_9FUNG|nr:hypothetical protein BDA99DRAFT_512829 [Phascolomyces articulosus]
MIVPPSRISFPGPPAAFVLFHYHFSPPFLSGLDRMSLRHASSIHNSDFNDQDSAIPYQLILNSTKWDFSNDAKTIQCALDVDKNDVAIKQATLTINDLEMTIANILKIKAIACAKKEQYDKEFQDKTIFMNKVVSVHHDPEEYLLDGRRYAEQGLQKQAIQMFNKGLELQRLAEKEDPHCYYELTSERNQAQTRLDSRIDFFARFPYDIVCRVIDFIPLETIVQCSRVSSLWRTLILDCPNPWRHIDTHILTKSGISLPFKFLPLISHHVESLVLPQNGQGILCMSAIRTINLPKFRSLYIKDAGKKRLNRME